MNYEKIIDMGNITIGDCLYLYENQNLVSVLNDGYLVNFEQEE